MSDVDDLYETDFAVWAETQAGVLRAARDSGANIPLDWENLVEEVESLGRSQRSELRSRLDTVMDHLLKLAASPAIEPRPGWKATVRRERDDIEALLDVNRSLVREVASIIERDLAKVAKRVTDTLADYGEDDPATLATLRGARFTAEQVQGDWFPPDPDPA